MKPSLSPATLAELDQKLQPVAEAIALGEAVLFPGAALSVSVGAPSVEELIAQLKSELNPVSTTETDPRLIAQFYRNQVGDDRFSRRAREIYGKKTPRPGPAHAALAQLPVNVVLTTNYDDLVERALADAGKTVKVVCGDAGLAQWSEYPEVQVLKLHGDLATASAMVFSAVDYHRFLAANTAVRQKLNELFRFRTIVFIGCSVRETDVTSTLCEMREAPERLARESYHFTFSDDPHCLAEWKRKGIAVIRIPQAVGESKGESLARALGRLKILVEGIAGQEKHSLAA